MRSICPECGNEGTRTVYWKPSKSDPRIAYLRFIHYAGGKRTLHDLGRIRSTEEVMKEWNKEVTVEDYHKVLVALTKDIRDWIYSYSPNRALRKPLQSILAKYSTYFDGP